MAGSVNEDYGAGGSSSLTEGMSSDQRCLSADALAEWRSSEQVENGTPSTSPPYWDTDEDDDDSGLKPSELYGKHTWKIENFSQINKRELKSDAFEIGGYKWYILIYPQGCDVSNHLSLFLCVANHDKLLPGWSHFAQFTIAVVNKDPKKTKYSDTLHRFWKKEHDWGWKKFMELSKVSDGFVVTDDLVIKAQVQVIREKANRPFRCLDRHYRRELVRIYLTNVEQICRRFVEEKRSKLCKLIEDKMRWSSFHAFWLGIDQNAKRQMSRDKTEAILKVVVKQFFIEKEVTSTLVMDSLYSGLRALECQSKKERAEAEDLEELPVPMVHIENDMFVLADDVLRLLERAALQPLPHQPLPTKDEKSSQSRAKDGLSGEDFSRDSIVRDEKRLTELGRRTVEIFVLAHIFSRIEVAYQEAVALKRQEELIREEEAAGQIENGLKTKRAAAEKEKRAKKKQAKQKKNSRKGKNKGRDEKSDVLMQVKRQLEIPSGGRILEGYASRNSQTVIEKIEALEEASVVSDMGDDVPESLQPELEDRDNSSTNWDTDTSERHHAAENSINERETWRTDKTSPSVIDDSCSTCSTDSVPSVAINGSYKGNSLPKNTGQSSPIRIKDQQSRDLDGLTGSNRGGNIKTSNATSEAAHLSDDADSYTDPQHEPEAVTLSNKDRLRRDDHHLVDKEVAANLQKKVHGKDSAVEQSSKSRAKDSSSSQSTPGNKLTSASQPANKSSESSAATASKVGPVFSKEASLLNTSQTKKSIPTATKSLQAASVTEAEKGTTPSKNTASHQVPAMSRPLSTPLIPPPRSSGPIVSTVQTMPLLSRSVSASGRLGTVPSPSASSYIPQSYRNAIIGKTTTGPNATSSTHTFTPSSSQAVMYSQPPSTFISSAPMLSQTSAINSQTSLRPGLTFGSVNHEALQNQQPWRRDYSNQQATSSGQHDLNFVRETNRLNIGGNSLGKQPFGVVSSNVNSDQAQRIMSDEFPHLAIINDLLDEDQSGSCQASHHPPLNRHYTFPRDYSSVDVGSLSGPGHYEQADLYYGDGVHGVYGSSNGALHGLRDANLGQMDILGYANGHVEGMNHNQWPYLHADLSMLSLGSVDANGYQYQISDHLNSGRGENGYNMYHPSSGF